MIPGTLNPQQDVIVAWIAMGLTRKEIAGNLKRDTGDVDYHLMGISAKLGFHDTARLTHYALARGLVGVGQTI